MACSGCARRRKVIKKVFRNMKPVNKVVSVLENRVITSEYVAKMRDKFKGR